MNPQLAALAFTIGIAGLFWLDRDLSVRPSKALWLPALWLAIGGSRNVGEWVQSGVRVDAGNSAYLEGNPLDRNILAFLMLLGTLALLRRRRQVVACLKTAGPLVAYISYALISLSWSDYPGVGVRRWFRVIGDIIMILVIVTDVDPKDAIQRVLKRVGFVLVPVSLLLIRYYPDLGRAYSPDGTLSWTGVAAGKNGLGIVCLIFGFHSVWRLLLAIRGAREPNRRRRIIANVVVLGLTVWLLQLANSMTSFSCFVLATVVAIAITKKSRQSERPGISVRNPVLVHTVTLATVAVAMSVLFFGASALLSTLGRDPTLTGRTNIWKIVLGYVDNPVFGAGFETFWIGKRIVDISSAYTAMNQAHNGYIEVYLNLGWVGIALLVFVIFRGYRNVSKSLYQNPDLAILKLGFLIIALIYNCTEGAFKFMTPVWFGFLYATAVAATATPEISEFGRMPVVHDPYQKARVPRSPRSPGRHAARPTQAS